MHFNSMTAALSPCVSQCTAQQVPAGCVPGHAVHTASLAGARISAAVLLDLLTAIGSGEPAAASMLPSGLTSAVTCGQLYKWGRRE